MKHWLQSKTIWFNAVIACLAAAEASFSMLKPYLGESTYGVALFAVTIINVYLRCITSKPLASQKSIDQSVQ
jgi:hypothetical protein